MITFSQNEFREFFFADLKQRRRRLKRDKIDQSAAIVAMVKFSFRPFADHLYLFKLDHDLSLSLCCHRLTHRRVKILVSIFFADSLEFASIGNCESLVLTEGFMKNL